MPTLLIVAVVLASAIISVPAEAGFGGGGLEVAAKTKDRRAAFEKWMRVHHHDAVLADSRSTTVGQDALTHAELYERFSATMDEVDRLNEKAQPSSSTVDGGSVRGGGGGDAVFAPNHLALLSHDEFKRRFSSNTLIAGGDGVAGGGPHIRRSHLAAVEAKAGEPALLSSAKKDICYGLPPGVSQWSVTQNRSKTNALANTTVDWQKAGAVTRVRNQGGCGSCYVFAMVAALEGMYQIKNKVLLAFSEQYALDCGPRATCLLGCSGGSTIALAGVMQTQDDLGDFPLAKNYEYEAYDNHTETCNTAVVGHPGTQLTKAYSIISSYAPSTSTSVGDAELVMQAYLQEHGPLAVALDASSSEWQHYAGGVLTNPCLINAPPTKESDLNHGVTIVGYGTTPEGTDYWRVKNSWTPKWGEEGYVLIERGCNAYGIGYFPVGGSLK